MSTQVALVDDERSARDFIKSLRLWRSGQYSLSVCASSATELLAYLAQIPVDIILMDVSMPGMDGILLSKTISELYPLIDIVAVSNYDSFPYVSQILKNGAKDYLLKQ